MPTEAKPQRVVLITGAAGGLGQAVVAHFAAEGVGLVLLDREGDALRSRATQFRAALALGVNLLDAAAVAAAVAQAHQALGRIDVAVHLAGGFAMGEPVHATKRETWQQMFDLNVNTMLNSAAAVVPLMKAQHGEQKGAIVNVGAYAAQRGAALMGAYIASKSAVMRLTESMSAELRDEGIRVNAVLPSTLDTPANRAAMPEVDPKRWVAPEALAAVIGFLAGDGARAVHGACIPVTGLG